MPEKTTHPKIDEIKLTEEEIILIADTPDKPLRRIAISLMAKCGLRVSEAIRVTPNDIITDSEECSYVQTETSRSVPLPNALSSEIQNYVDKHQVGQTENIIDFSRETISRWVDEVAKECYKETGDETWLEISAYDLHGSWIRLLMENDVPTAEISEISGIPIDKHTQIGISSQVKKLEWYP